ncbi:hypothetical protein TCAL_10819 [Tigriopus californicus]|uniref:Transcription factor TFIIIC triple barrel domain-containing protein n=1 Tax=Tigriopus californicus TaxID=6832 RepID=A0A553NAX6_TIGCA|nr:hypothetical protein TCAL_10819 [Tigriopus californicus]|eukprot:TCALIF_10819-PA protein Name:"Similar to Gtf3c6 General transcription factor 3C polypeptide 6 (Mus musculus)" AED:0.42 eAED:0.53 QI:0/-1/0/1/-1/1/1/0/138
MSVHGNNPSQNTGEKTFTKSSNSVNESDSEWESDGEELIHVELTGIFQDELKRNPDIQIKFIGIESEHPIVQLGNQVFEGEHSQTLGTSVIFTKKSGTDPTSANLDPVFQRPIGDSLEYLCRSDSKLLCKRVFLNAKS